MSKRYVSSGETNDQSQSSPTVETLSFRVEPTSVPAFITKLFTILNDNTIKEMVSWSNDGERFCVYDIPRFSKTVLPQHFKHSNWPSFVRQLNMYGFHKMNDNFSARHGRLICEFHHPLFYQNGQRALRKIRRNSKRSAPTSLDGMSRQHQPQHLPQRKYQQEEQQQRQQQRQEQHQQLLPQQERQQQTQKRQQQQQYTYHNNPHRNQIHPSQGATQSTTAYTASVSSYIPVLSLLSTNDQTYNNNPTVYKNQSTNENNNESDSKNNEIEYQVTCMIDGENKRRLNGKNQNNSTPPHFDNNEYNRMINSSNSMDIYHLTTENNDENNNASTSFANQNRPPNVDYGLINMDVDDECSNQRINNDGKNNTDYQGNIDNNNNNCNSIDEFEVDKELSTELYIVLSGQLNQLRKKTTDLNSELFLLKRYVAQLQQSVVVLLNCLSDMISCSDLHSQELLDKIQLELAKTTSNGKNNTRLDDEEQRHISHDHLHHDYQGKGEANNEQGEQIDDFNNINYGDDINTLKKGIRDILQKSRQGTEMAKKNHHMHLHPQGHNNWNSNCTTLLDTSNNKQQQQ